jgi:hypothetical protein
MTSTFTAPLTHRCSLAAYSPSSGAGIVGDIMLAAYRRWRDNRRAVKAEAARLIEEFDQAAWIEVRRREWHPGISDEQWEFNRRVRDAVADQLGIDWCPDTATRYVEGTIGRSGIVRRQVADAFPPSASPKAAR